MKLKECQFTVLTGMPVTLIEEINAATIIWMQQETATT